MTVPPVNGPATAPHITDTYLAETRYDHGAGELRLFDGAGLAEWLARNIEHEHYSGNGTQVLGIWRYKGNGKLTRLRVRMTGEIDGEDDYLDWRYEVYKPVRPDIPDDVGPVVMAFTVRIDGRA